MQRISSTCLASPPIRREGSIPEPGQSPTRPARNRPARWRPRSTFCLNGATSLLWRASFGVFIADAIWATAGSGVGNGFCRWRTAANPGRTRLLAAHRVLGGVHTGRCDRCAGFPLGGFHPCPAGFRHSQAKVAAHLGCATDLTGQLCRCWTSIRVEGSLPSGTSSPDSTGPRASASSLPSSTPHWS